MAKAAAARESVRSVTVLLIRMSKFVIARH
jgi:hypothetical protein